MNETAATSAAEFYDTLAPDYDQMTGFESRFAREGPFFTRLIEERGIGSALDAGCGTGFHSFLLAQLGVAVTAVDLSVAMLDGLRRHAVERKLSIVTVQSSFQELPRHIKTVFDGVFCMGNSLAHLLSTDDLRLALDSFLTLLNPGGLLVLQLLNFERILLQRPRILSVKTGGDAVYTRYYEYADPLIRFNITKSTKDGTQPNETITTTLRPIVSNELSHMLGKVGFEHVRCFGSISLEEYAPATSQDLLVLASKKG